MTPRSQSRLLLLAFILLVIGIGLYRYDRHRTRGAPSAPRSEATLKDGISGEAGRDVAKTVPNERSKERSLAKLHSLLELRKGELAFIRLSPATMRSLPENPDSPLRGTAPDQDVAFVGTVSREWMEVQLTEMVETEGTVDGSVDPSDGSFEWAEAGFVVSGSTAHLEGSARFNIHAKEGGMELESLVRQPLGSMMLFKRAGLDSGGVLVVVGDDR